MCRKSHLLWLVCMSGSSVPANLWFSSFPWRLSQNVIEKMNCTPFAQTKSECLKKKSNHLRFPPFPHRGRIFKKFHLANRFQEVLSFKPLLCKRTSKTVKVLHFPLKTVCKRGVKLPGLYFKCGTRFESNIQNFFYPSFFFWCNFLMHFFRFHRLQSHCSGCYLSQVFMVNSIIISTSWFKEKKKKNLQMSGFLQQPEIMNFWTGTESKSSTRHSSWIWTSTEDDVFMT